MKMCIFHDDRTSAVAWSFCKESNLFNKVDIIILKDFSFLMLFFSSGSLHTVSSSLVHAKACAHEY